MPSPSRPCLGVSRTSRTPNGWRSSYAMASCGPASCHPNRRGSSGSSPAIVRPWCKTGRGSSTACRRCWRTRTASSRLWSRISAGSPPERCWRRSSRGHEMSTPSQSWRAGGCARSGTNWRTRDRAILPPTIASWSRRSLSQIDDFDDAIDRVSAVIAQHLEAEPEAMALLDTIPGVSQRTAEILLADIGTDMTRFPSAKHLASWAGMCPGHHEGAGKRLSGKTRKGSRWLRQVLVEAAHVAAKTKQTYLAAQYQRIAARRGKKRALIALGHTMLVIVYTLLTRKQPYQDLGAAYFDSLTQQRVERRLVQRLERLGYQVSLQPRSL